MLISISRSYPIFSKIYWIIAVSRKQIVWWGNIGHSARGLE
jgi:hypothetical protein